MKLAYVVNWVVGRRNAALWIDCRQHALHWPHGD